MMSKFDRIKKQIEMIKQTIPEVRLGIVGSRSRDTKKDLQIVFWFVKQLKPKVIVSGECKQGADAFAKRIAIVNKKIIEYDPHPPQFPPNFNSLEKWEQNEVYYSRNREIVESANVLLALESKHKDGGTRYTVDHWIKHKGYTYLILV